MSANDDLVASLTTYAHSRDSALYGDAPQGVPLALWRAYGPRYPGGPLRSAEAQRVTEDYNARLAREKGVALDQSETSASAAALDLVEFSLKTCSVEGCARPPKARTFCHRHYARWWHHGHTDLVPRPVVVIPSPAEVMAECTAALADFEALVHKEAS